MKTIGFELNDYHGNMIERFKEACQKARITYSKEAIITKAYGELLELNLALLYYAQGFTTERYCHLQEEIVDVLFMIVQVGLFVDLEKNDYWFEKKLEKLEQDLKNHGVNLKENHPNKFTKYLEE